VLSQARWESKRTFSDTERLYTRSIASYPQ
jgi:hypothetical protein